MTVIVHGWNIQEAREGRGWTRTEFAEKMGVARKHLVALERGLVLANEQEQTRLLFLTRMPEAFFCRPRRPTSTAAIFVCERPSWA